MQSGRCRSIAVALAVMTPPDPAVLLADLNPAQRLAVEAATGPVCILAGAGTGKTRTITRRIAYQVATGVARPSEILAVTFTDKAASELRQRLARLGLDVPIRAATFHAAAWAQLRYFWSDQDRGPLPEVLPSKVRLLVPLARRTKTQAQDLAAEIEWAKARRLSPEDYTAHASGRDAPLDPTAMAEVYRRYEDIKQSNGLIDYEDMLLRTTAALEDNPEIAAGVRERYRFFTVDEFQDVNPAQFALLRAWLGDRNDVCVVGDDDQTIYSFTGASSNYLTDFRTHFPDAGVVTLTENYRSTPQVLTLANRVLQAKPVHLSKKLMATLPDGPQPIFTPYDDADTEQVGIVRRIRQLIADGTPPGEIAVCYRVNSQSEALESAFKSARIPYVVRGAGSFYERKEVRQALAVLRAATDRPPEQPPVGLEDTVAARPPSAAEEVQRALRDQMAFNPRKEPDGEAARERWRNLAAVVEAAESIEERQPGASLRDVVDEMHRRAREGADSPTEHGAVSLLTLHKAKGLEFDAVFLIAVEEGLLPISHAKTAAEVEEERRLLYVGVTRARRHLFISWALQRPGWGGKLTKRRPSQFLAGLGEGAPAAARPKVVPAKVGSRTCACGRPLVGSADRKRGACWSCFSGGADVAVAERLRAWRKERATADEVPAFVVFGDKTLAELARVKPKTPQALLSVSGLGPAKVARYGEDLLDVLAES